VGSRSSRRAARVAAGMLAVAVMATTSCGRGGSWTEPFILDQPPPTRPPAVACSGASFCLAGGEHLHRWDGTTWTPLRSPGEVVSDLSCATPTFCLALVGTDRALRWDGNEFVPTAPADLGAGGRLTTVACPADGRCLALGVDGSGAVAARSGDGASWQAIPPPPGLAGPPRPMAVSCWLADACMAAGGTAAAVWDGTAWSPQQVPTVASASSQEMTSLSCRPITSVLAPGCAAVGSVTTGAITYPLVAFWSATQWRSSRLLLPIGSVGARLQSVSCGPMRCLAVGEALLNQPGVSRTPYVAEVYENVTGAVIPADAAPLLNDVSCHAWRSTPWSPVQDQCHLVAGRTVLTFTFPPPQA
jgi:hypothetical protein